MNSISATFLIKIARGSPHKMIIVGVESAAGKEVDVRKRSHVVFMKDNVSIWSEGGFGTHLVLFYNEVGDLILSISGGTIWKKNVVGNIILGRRSRLDAGESHFFACGGVSGGWGIILHYLLFALSIN